MQSTQSGTDGFFLARTGAPFTGRLVVKPGGAGFNAGLRTGDIVKLRDLSPAQRYRLHDHLAGDRIILPVRREGRLLTIAYVAPRVAPGPLDWLFPIVGCLILVFAAVLAWRRSDSSEVRILALLLISFPIIISLQNWHTSWLALDVPFNAACAALGWTAPALFVFYTSLFARPLSRLRRILTWGSYATAFAWSALNFVEIFARLTAVVDPLNGALWSGLGKAGSGSLRTGLDIIAFLLPLVCAFAAIAATRGAERLRLIWATCSVGLFWAAMASEFALNAWFSRYAALMAVVWIVDVAYLLMPIGLTYTLLNRRLLDIGFALNRAAVFSGVSIVIVGIFVLVEWALGDWLSHLGHSENLAISAGLALVLGLSLRVIHQRVDGVVDTVFFRKRHENEKAIRTFARTCAYITDAAVLLQRAAETLERHADATFVTFALDGGSGRYGDVSENDPALLALRADGKIVDLHAMQTELPGEFAYPMIARGRLVGALTLGPRTSGESYAPDESDAILQLAHNAAAVLDVLAQHQARGTDMASAIANLAAKIDTLPARIAAELAQASAITRSR